MASNRVYPFVLDPEQKTQRIELVLRYTQPRGAPWAAIPDPLSGELSPETSALYQELVSRRGRIDGMYRFLLNHPDLLQRISDLGTYFRFQSTVLPSRVREFAILVTARELRAGYEWVKHVSLALEAGLKQETIEQLRHGSSPSLGQEFMDVRDACLLALAPTSIPSALQRRLEEAYTIQGVIELVGLVGFYRMIAGVIACFDVPLPAGEVDPFYQAPA